VQIHIQNFRGIEEAQLQCNGVALITGTNATGKTSIAQAVAAVLTGNPIPMAGIRKNAAGMLVHTGAAQGQITLEGEEGTAMLSWPAAKVQTDGSPPQASAIAAGLESLADEARPANRARLLSPYLKADPTQEDLSEQLPNLKPEHITALWDKIQVDGWDLVYDHAKTTGAEYKGRWHQATGEAYGSKKASSWFPDNWDDDLTGMSEQALAGMLDQDRTTLDDAISNKAIGEVELKTLEESAARPVDMSALEDAVKKAKETHWESIKARNDLPPAQDKGSPIEIHCPHCENPVIVTQKASGGFSLHKITHVSKKEMKDRGLAIAAADGKISHDQDSVWAEERKLAEGKRLLKEIKGAQSRLQEIRSRQENVTSDQLDACREQVRLSEARLAAFRKKREADRLHATVEANQQVISVLAPDGLRAWKLTKAVGSLNREVLAPLSQEAGWDTVSLNDDLMPTLGGRLYPLLSESEQFRARVTLQVALSRMDGSDAMIIDRADILDRQGRNGMMKMLIGLGIPCLVCMTILDPKKDPPPDLAARGKGVTYWVEDGIAKPLSQFMKAA
jgi:hypothetical protein